MKLISNVCFAGKETGVGVSLAVHVYHQTVNACVSAALFPRNLNQFSKNDAKRRIVATIALRLVATIKSRLNCFLMASEFL
jgi:hypothetical protein